MFDESSSIQLVCEDSDYAPESVMHSLLLFESTKRVQEEDEKELLQTLAFLSDLNINKAEAVAENAIKRQKNFAKLIYEREEIKSITPELDESYNQNISEYLIDMGQKISGNSKMIENPRSSSSEDDDFENIQKPIQHFNVSLNAKARGSTNALEDETNSLHEIESIDDKDEILDELDDLMLICNSHTSIIDSIDLLPTIMEDSENSKIANSFMSVSTNTVVAASIPNIDVLAILSPEVRAKVEAFMVIGESFDVLIEQPDDAQDFTVKLLDHISDSVSLDLMLPKTVKVDLSLTRSGQCEGILSYQVGNLVIGNENDEERISMTSDDERHHHHSFEAVQDKEQHTGITVNIIARSMHDVARALLEEIPGEKYPCISHDSGTRNSLIQNVTVSESNETEKRSLHSHESFRSLSQQSFDWTEFSDQSASWQNLNVPNYVVREGSTATITCEFNNFLTPGSLIDWFKGKTMMQIIPGKIDRISHDLLEVLVISHVSLMDGDVYNIRVNDVIYPVACLIVENTDVSSEKLNDDIRFISPPQTLFVMEGQPSIISCQVNNANQKVEWCKDNKKWVTENERIRLEADQFGDLLCFLGDNFTTVTLVVEERIDEREVTISALGTDIKDDDYREYLVPLGSTATIACELENSDEVKELVWRKDGIQIEFSDDAKVEHVVNGLKHYLVIHDTQVDDSASYSICINDIEFKIAHLIVSSCAATIGSFHIIARQSKALLLDDFGTLWAGEYRNQVTVEESLVPAGSAATIHCETITQQYSLDWRKNLQPITQNERIEKKDTADGFEHSLTIHSIRKNDEGEYGVVIKDSYTAVTKITVIESQEQIATEDFDISLHPTPSLTNEAFAQLFDHVNLQHTFETYQLCAMEEYFDLRFSMQSFEIPVVVNERRSASVSYLSRELSIQAMEKEIHIRREPSFESSKDLTFVEVTTIECNLLTTHVRFEFTPISVAHAVAESMILTLIEQQSAQINLNSQCNELSISFVNQSVMEQLTIIVIVRSKIVEKLETKLDNRWIKLDVILFSPMKRMETSTKNKIPKMITLEMHFPALTFEHCDKTIIFDRVSEREYHDATMPTKLIIFPEKIRRQFAINIIWLELIVIYRVPQVSNSVIKIAIAQKEMLHLQCKASKAVIVDEIFTVCGPIQQQNATVIFSTRSSVAMSKNYMDSFSSLKIMLRSHFDRDQHTSKKILLIKTETTNVQLTVAAIEVFPVIHNFSMPTQDECVEIKIFMKSFIGCKINKRHFTDSLVKLKLELWSNIERNLFVVADFRTVAVDRLSARFFGSTAEYFTISTAFTTQSQMDAAVISLLTKTPKIVEKINRLFLDTVVNVISEYRPHHALREFCADFIILTPRIDACIANFRASTSSNLYVIILLEIQSQENNALITLSLRTPAITERSSIMFSDNLVQKTAEFRSRIKHNLEEIFSSQEDTLIENIESAEIQERSIMVMIETQPEKGSSEITLLSQVPALIQKFSRSFSDTIANLITELHVQSDFCVNRDILIGQIHRLQMYLKASKEENINIKAKFCIQNEIENIMATFLTRAPTIVMKDSRKFLDNVVKFATELYSLIFREAFVDVNIYIANKDKIQRQLKPSSVKDTYISIALEEYPEAEKLEMYLKASSEEYTNTLANFEAQIKADNIMAILMAQVPTVVEKNSRKFSITTTELTFEIWSQFCREIFARRNIHKKQEASVKLDLKASTFEVQIFLTNFELQSEAENITAVMFTRAQTIAERTNMAFSSNKERQFANVRVPSFENIEIDATFEFHPEKELLSTIVISEKIIEMETLWNRTQLSVELYQHLNLTSPVQTNECTFIICENICKEDESTDEISTSSIHAVPQFAESLNEIYKIEEFATHSFKCIIYGTPAPQVRWYHNEQAIMPSDNITMIAEDGIYILKINSVDRTWSGSLVCEAENVIGTVRTHSIIHVQRSDERPISSTSTGGQSPVIQLPLDSEMHVKKGENIQLKCVVSGNPLPSVQWKHNDIIIENNEHYSTLCDDGIYILNVLNVTEEDNAIFSCTAMNLFGAAKLKLPNKKENSLPESIVEHRIMGEISSSSISSQDSFTTQFQIPIFILPLNDITILETEELQLKCIVMGEPMPTIRWTYNGKEIQADSRNIFTVYEDGIIILKITKGEKEGLYVCEATNGIGSAQTRSFVRICNPEVLLVTAMELESSVESAEAVVLSVSMSNFCSIADVTERKNEMVEQDQKERKSRKTFDKEEITTDQYIPAGTLNYLIEAEALTIKDRIIERPSYWSRETINERVEFEKTFHSDKLHEFLEDKEIIERYVNLLKAAETVEFNEKSETRFKLRQFEGVLEKRQLEIHEEQARNLAKDNGVFTTVHCVANAMSYVVEASPHFIQSFNVFEEGFNTGLRCSVDGLPAPYIRISHNGCPILRSNRFFHVIYKNGIITLYMQHILEGHYVCEAINAIGRTITECYIRIEEAWNENQHRKIRRIRVENTFEEIGKIAIFERRPATSFIEVSVIQNVYDTSKRDVSKAPQQDIDTSITVEKPRTDKKAGNETKESLDINEQKEESPEAMKKSVLSMISKATQAKMEQHKEKFTEKPLEKGTERELIDVFVISVTSESTQVSVCSSKQEKNEQVEEIVEKQIKPKANIEDKKEGPVAKMEKNEMILNLEKDLEHEAIDVSISSYISESSEASVRILKESKMKEPRKEIVEDAMKPEEEIVEDKMRVIEKMEEKEIILNLEKDLEHEAIDVSISSYISESSQTSIRLPKGTEMVQPMEAKMEEPRHEAIDVSISSYISESSEASVRILKESKMKEPRKEIVEDAMKPEEEIVEDKMRHEAIDVSISSYISESSQTSIRLPKGTEMVQSMEAKMEEPRHEAIDVSISSYISESSQTSIRLPKGTEMVQPMEAKMEEPRHEAIDVSISSYISESSEASVRILKESKMKEPRKEIVEDAMKPEEEIVEDKMRVIEKMEEKEIILNLEKDLEHEAIDVSISSYISESSQASEIVEDKMRVIEKMEEKEIILNLEKDLEHEAIDVSISSYISESSQTSIRLPKGI
ncbi:hypothetical protein DINM_022653 [Dirofilaria immitis]|nr:hypothetical protein [Dirofilaria immitis]